MSVALTEFVGVWELDPTTLSYQFGRPGLRAQYTVRAIPRGLEFILDADDADGKPMHVCYGGSLDGQDIQLPDIPITLALRQLSDGSIESVAKKDGRPVDRWTRTLAPDRQSMVITQHGVAPDGKSFLNSGVYRRVAKKSTQV